MSTDTTRSSRGVKPVTDLTIGITDRDVLIVEDIVDSGQTLSWLLNTFEARHPRSLRTVALLDKRSRRTVEVGVEHVGFTIDDRFVVGYGLDLAEQFRHNSVRRRPGSALGARGETPRAPRPWRGTAARGHCKARRGSQLGICDRGATPSRRDAASVECSGAFTAGSSAHPA